MRLFRIWLRPGGGEENDLSPECLKDNVILLGWTYGGIDLRKPIDAGQLRAKVKQHYARKHGNRYGGYVSSQFLCFFKTMEETPGSIVLVPDPKMCHVARITGQVESRNVAGENYYCRPVRWIKEACRSREALSRALQKEINNQPTCREIQNERCIREVKALIKAGPEDVAPESTNNNVRGVKRRPAIVSDQLSTFEYMVEPGKRKVFPAHKHFQSRLEGYLKHVQVSDLKFEPDFVDVTFSRGKAFFIGEAKVTNGYISPSQAFRAALGQILEYRFTRKWGTKPHMIIFLDQEVDSARLKLANRLGISVVVETQSGAFRLANRGKDKALCTVFPPMGEYLT